MVFRNFNQLSGSSEFHLSQIVLFIFLISIDFEVDKVEHSRSRWRHQFK